MRVLLVSKFVHHVGGVETYVRWQAGALAAAGHEVGIVGMAPPVGESVMQMPGRVWTTPTRSYASGVASRMRSAAASVWSTHVARVMGEALRELRPDIVHFHGTCYQLTPSVVDAARHAGVPAVLTAHEYKLVCANQRLYDHRASAICTDCVGASAGTKVSAPLRRRCVKGSAAASLIGAVEGRVADRVWASSGPLVLTPSRFMRDVLLSDGWAPERVHYLDLAWRADDELPRPLTTGSHVVFLGRLAPEKGVDLLLEVWSELAERHPERRLRIIGDGADEQELRQWAATRRLPRVDFLGRLDAPQIQAELAGAAVTAHPAQWFENSPFAVRESLMAGVPAVVAALGGMPEMVPPEAGRSVPYDDRRAWVAALDDALTNPPDAQAYARAVTERAMTDTEHLGRLVGFYDSLVGTAPARATASPGADGRRAPRGRRGVDRRHPASGVSHPPQRSGEASG